VTLDASAYRNLLLYVLDKTKDEKIDAGRIVDGINITSEALSQILGELEEQGLIERSQELVSSSVEQRVEMAVKAIEYGADFERVSQCLGWLEFEELVARVFRENGFNTLSRYRFKADGRRWEIDVLATSYPYIICAECKHYTREMGNSLARNIIETHIEKTGVLSRHIAEVSRKIDVNNWGNAVLVPITLTLQPTKMNVYRRVPSVSVFMLPSFLSEFSGHLERMVSYSVEIPEEKPKPKQLKLR